MILFNPLPDFFTCLECEYTYDEYEADRNHCPKCNSNEIDSLWENK